MRTGGFYLVALALPVAVGRHRPTAVVLHAVVVDVDVRCRGQVVVVHAPPPVDAAVDLLRDPTGCVGRRLDLAGDGQVALIELARVAGGVRSGRRSEQSTDGDCTHREGGCNSLLDADVHFNSSYQGIPEGSPDDLDYTTVLSNFDYVYMVILYSDILAISALSNERILWA